MKKLINIASALGLIALCCSFSWWPWSTPDCPWCGGRGVEEGTFIDIKCKGCKGKGKVEKVNKCEGCNGKGYIDGGLLTGKKPHTLCRGTGKIPIPLPDSKAE